MLLTFCIDSRSFRPICFFFSNFFFTLIIYSFIQGPSADSSATLDGECEVQPKRYNPRSQSTRVKKTPVCGKRGRSIVTHEVGQPVAEINKQGLRQETKRELSQRSMDQYCISSPQSASRVSSSQRSSVSTSTLSRCSSPQSSKRSDSPSLLRPSGVTLSASPYTSEAESSIRQTSDTCSDVLASPNDDDVVFLKIVSSQSSVSGMHSSAVSPRLSPLAQVTANRLQNSQLQKQGRNRKHLGSAVDSDLCIINKEKFFIDTSDCLRSSFQDLSSIIPQRGPRSLKSEVSECSMKAVPGSSNASSVSSLSDISSRTFSSGSVFSNESGSLNADTAVKVRRSTRVASRSSCYSSSSSNSCPPLKKISCSSDIDKMSVCRKKSTLKSEPDTTSFSESQAGSNPLTSQASQPSRICLPFYENSPEVSSIQVQTSGIKSTYFDTPVGIFYSSVKTA